MMQIQGVSHTDPVVEGVVERVSAYGIMVKGRWYNASLKNNKPEVDVSQVKKGDTVTMHLNDRGYIWKFGGVSNNFNNIPTKPLPQTSAEEYGERAQRKLDDAARITRLSVISSVLQSPHFGEATLSEVVETYVKYALTGEWNSKVGE